MTAQEFNTRLRDLLHKTPFQPFVVEYESGERFEVAAPHVAFTGGAASCQASDGEIYFFNCKNVRQFAPALQEKHS